MADTSSASPEDGVTAPDVDDGPSEDPELESSLRRGEATFIQWASSWYFSRAMFNERETSRRRWQRYRDRLYPAFENAYGRVVDSYYCEFVPAAAVLTYRVIKRKKSFGRESEDEDLRLHIMDNQPDGAERDADATAALDLISQCNNLANQVVEDLNGPERRRCLEMVFGLVTAALDILDQAAVRLSPERFAMSGFDPGEPLKRESTLVVLARRRFEGVVEYYDRMAERRAQFEYFRGVGVGASIVFTIALALWLIMSAADGSIVSACIAGGAAGAVMSVLFRVTFGRFYVAYDVGRRYVWLSGASRPLVGAVFGLLLYFSVIGGWMPLQVPTAPDARFGFFLVGAFLAGYGERFAQDLLSEGRRRISGASPSNSAVATAVDDADSHGA